MKQTNHTLCCEIVTHDKKRRAHNDMIVLAAIFYFLINLIHPLQIIFADESNPINFESMISLEHASVVETYKGYSDYYIFHIQDAHAHYGAQKNLAKILDDMIRQFGIKWVFIEGGVGNDSLSFLRTLATKEIRTKVADRYLESGNISGAEYLDIVSDLDIKLWGMEDQDLYKESRLLYRQVLESRSTILTYLDDMANLVDEFKDAHKNSALKELEIQIDALNANDGGFESYLNLLIKTHPQKELLLEDYDMADRFDRSQRLQKEILNESSILKRNELQLMYSKISQGLDIGTLWSEANLLESDLIHEMAKNEDLEKLTILSRRIRLLREYFLIQVRPYELDFYQNNPSEFRAEEWVVFLNRLIKDRKMNRDFIYYRPSIELAQKRINSFYANTEKRDIAFIKNSLKKMDEVNESKAVIISGGYHTPHLTKRLREKGVSYVVMAPHIEGPWSKSKYDDLLLSAL
ncbi:MAG: hypothetical protein ACI9CF_000195 [Candidatus Omnitrophota bacterium]|jgi:hypothetical protein